ncbi:DUF1659 domain-containing protein [Ammoniphilus sp. CFH 90114]|uniref:DUF1659 domain-containing protein n=1 Tax=Ammoniphilus sp. CFH 90114 TaxID=2493665 RepID=UPI00100F0741|nr:DUF1659 domain-containing protein [Ammoniphilus sp. CFH 90114]RXT00963.1 DUF1659 domain-containing protein [Ammoniphilus sp. CFH 90114]
MLTTKDVKEIKLIFAAGMDEQGKTIRKSRIYKNVNAANATLENVHAFGQAIAALSQWPLDQVILTNSQEIIEVIA